MKIVIYGLTITSSWGNGHATTYRSLAKALARKGHRIYFVEKDVEWYHNNRDLPEPEFCTVRLYEQWARDARELVALAADADVVLIGSYFPDAIAVTRALVNADFGPILFYDIDTPITMSQLREQGRTAYLEPSLIPLYDAYLSFTGGPALAELEDDFGASWAVPFYCSVDADMYRPVAPSPEFQCDLGYLGTYARDRQPKLMQLLNEPARLLPDRRFIVAGPQYPAGVPWQSNVKRMIHLSPREHPFFYSSSRFSLNLTRADMVAAGYSPSVRLFEASACGAAILSDHWPGLEEFFTPGEEVLLPKDAREVAEILAGLSDEERNRIGARARERILSQHTSEHRAAQFEEIVATCSMAKA
jgi:spore maturation protein CgeB